MSRIHPLALSAGYVEALLGRYITDPSTVPEDWRRTFEFLAAYFPELIEGGAPAPAPMADFLRRYGHLVADIDPLRRPLAAGWRDLAIEVTQRIAAAGPAADLDSVFELYAGSLAVETGHLDDPRRVEWIYARREAPPTMNGGARVRALTTVVRAETFERFMGRRLPGKKRFGAEGAESIHALVQRILDRAAAAGYAEVVIGAMHRGRLGLMAELFGQDFAAQLSLMKGAYPLAEPGRAADVPYHLGAMAEHAAPDADRKVTVRLLPNPSHLEAVNAVALGYARQRQDELGSVRKVLPLLLHTDASVVAQGVVAETLQLSGVAGHRVGGALNIVINNQVGFTTDPEEGRSSRHCTGQWKAIDSLIAHVNGDDLDAVLSAADLAFDYREAFGDEAVIDLVCVRANGHNELDEPRFTQPLYYALAADRTEISARYADRLREAGLIAPDLPASIAESRWAELEAASHGSNGPPMGETPQAIVSPPGEPAGPEILARLAAGAPPEGTFNPKAERLVAQRADEWRSAVTWPTAEVMAVGAVLSAGWNVRLAGQDVERGAFSQRHFALVDTETGARRRVFENRPDGWGSFEVCNTPLCEYAALAFEYGYSVAANRTLTIWEAQFGDFANGAQIVLDQFISSGDEKWRQTSGLVVFLPHGLEGQGPEHSSGRIERMLQLAAKDNMRIAHPSTPANYYHLLVSQMREAPRRPLIVFTPKKLLRLKAAVSPPAAFRNQVFAPLIAESVRGPVRRRVICSGKIAYDVIDALAKSGREDVGVLRLEQFYPFPEADLVRAFAAAPSAEVVWLQEEPANFGAWAWLQPRLQAAILAAGGDPMSLSCLARPESPSPAGSFHHDHDADQARLVAQAIGGPAAAAPRLRA